MSDFIKKAEFWISEGLMHGDLRTEHGQLIQDLVARILELEAQTEWVNVKDRLPDDPGDDDGTPAWNSILVYMPSLLEDKAFPGHSIMISNKIYLRKNIDRIPCWMSLPTPPEGKIK